MLCNDLAMNPNPDQSGLKHFKPGQSGNPKGRAKGSLNLSTILRRMLEEELEVVEDGARVKKPVKDILVRKLIRKAIKGEDLKAISEIFDRVDGKPKQTIDQNVALNERKSVSELFPFEKDDKDDE